MNPWLPTGPRMTTTHANRLWTDLRERGLQPWSCPDGTIRLTYPDTTRTYDTLRSAYEGAREHLTTLRRITHDD